MIVNDKFDMTSNHCLF